LKLVEDIRTELLDVSERVYGDVGVLTCWLEQDYTHDGRPQHVSGPATTVFRRSGDG
jgi:ketosteroid isomerase-like protein